MDSEDLKWIKTERTKREATWAAQDRHNTTEPTIDRNLYERILNADLHITPRKGQSLKSYLIELNIHIINSARKNMKIHIEIGVRGKPWYTHLRGEGCFMCEDLNMISVMYDVLTMISKANPKLKF